MIFWIALALVLIITFTFATQDTVDGVIAFIFGGVVFLGLIYSLYGSLLTHSAPAADFDSTEYSLVPINEGDGVYVIGGAEGEYTFLYEKDGSIINGSVYADDTEFHVREGEKPSYTKLDGVHRPGLWFPWTVDGPDKYILIVPEGGIVEAYELAR